MNASMEANIIHAVIEGEVGIAALELHEGFLDTELIEFHAALVRTIALVDRELRERNEAAADQARRAYESIPLADTGEINVIRGRE